VGARTNAHRVAIGGGHNLTFPVLRNGPLLSTIVAERKRHFLSVAIAPKNALGRGRCIQPHAVCDRRRGNGIREGAVHTASPASAAATPTPLGKAEDVALLVGRIVESEVEIAGESRLPGS